VPFSLLSEACFVLPYPFWRIRFREPIGRKKRLSVNELLLPYKKTALSAVI